MSLDHLKSHSVRVRDLYDCIKLMLRTFQLIFRRKTLDFQRSE